MCVTAPVFAQPTASEAEKFQARIDASALALGTHPRFKNHAPQHHQRLAEFVAGNMLFVMLHEMAHAAVNEMGLPVLGKAEDAADAFAATRLIKIESGVSDRVLTDASQGWFMADRRDKKEGNTVPWDPCPGVSRYTNAGNRGPACSGPIHVADPLHNGNAKVRLYQRRMGRVDT
jgi:hypothetical protein